MEGLVLSTAFISFAILAWLVIAKFGGGGSNSHSGTGCSDSEGSGVGGGASALEPGQRESLNEEGSGGGGNMVDGADDGSAAVDMPDETEHDEDGGGGTGKNRSLTEKRGAAHDDIGDDSSGVGTPSSSRRLSRRQRKNNRKREKEDKEKGNVRKATDGTTPRSGSSSSRTCLTVSGVSGTTTPTPTVGGGTSSVSPPPIFSTTGGGGSKSKKRSGVPCRQYEKLGLQDFQIYHCLMNYKLEDDRLRRLGFPMESELHPGKACVYQDPEFGSRSVGEVDDDDYRDDEQRSRIGSRCSSLLDVNAREFYPGAGGGGKSPPQQPTVTAVAQSSPSNAMDTTAGFSMKTEAAPSPVDLVVVVEHKASTLSEETSLLQHSTSTSSVLSASAKEFVPSFRHKTEAPLPVNTIVTSGATLPTVDREDSFRPTFFVGEGCEAKQCSRCSKIFYVSSEGQYLTKEGCTYHWGKLRARKRKDRWPEDDRFTCCGAPASEATRGCCQCRVHVWRHLTEPGMHGPLEGFVRTKARKCYPPDGNYGIYSIDGEMCFTTNGLELIKLTVVGVEGRLVYESLILPEGDIVDYNTRFSGISARDLKRGPAKTLREVQNDVMGFVNAHTILIGHGLENDLRALKVVHTTIIDTSIVFPHYYGLPYRRSLKSLVKSYLKREIQAASWGHDSYEDARACVELMLWKVRKDLPLFGSKLKDYDFMVDEANNPHSATVFFNTHEFGNIDQLGI